MTVTLVLSKKNGNGNGNGNGKDNGKLHFALHGGARPRSVVD